MGDKMNIESYEVIDNFLNNNEFEKLKEVIESPFFPWYFNETAVTLKEDYNLNNYQFTHGFYAKSEPISSFFNDVRPIINKINPKALIRVKANLNTPTEKIFEHGYHIDYQNSEKNQKTAVFYLNNNNGLTIFEDGTKVESVANRLLVFDTDLSHTGTTCTDKKRRIVINLNYFI